MKDFENYKDLHDLKLIIVVQHPRQYALEVANQRSELPDSGLYLDILKEYVQLVLNLVAQCDSINLIKSGKYPFLSQLHPVSSLTCPNFNLSQNLSESRRLRLSPNRRCYFKSIENFFDI